MSDLKKYLLVGLVVAAMVLVGRLAWEMMLPVIATIPVLLGGVPGWLWWTIFGISMSLLCPLKIALFGRRTCSPRRASA